MSKIKKKSEIISIVKRLKRQGKSLAFTNGCFDLLHPGHVKILRAAKNRADILIVGLNSDRSVRSIKGPERPILKQSARATLVAAFEMVDYVVLFDQPTPKNLIQALRPDVLIKGGDWKRNEIVGAKLVKKVYRVKLAPGYSTTSLIQKSHNHG